MWKTHTFGVEVVWLQRQTEVLPSIHTKVYYAHVQTEVWKTGVHKRKKKKNKKRICNWVRPLGSPEPRRNSLFWITLGTHGAGGSSCHRPAPTSSLPSPISLLLLFVSNPKFPTFSAQLYSPFLLYSLDLNALLLLNKWFLISALMTEMVTH